MWSHGKPAHCSPGTPLSCHPANLSIQKGSNRYPMRPNMAKPCSMNVPCSVMMCKMLHDFCAPGILRLQFRRARPWTFCSASKGVTIGIIGAVKELIRIGNCSRRTEIKKEWFTYYNFHYFLNSVVFHLCFWFLVPQMAWNPLHWQGQRAKNVQCEGPKPDN